MTPELKIGDIVTLKSGGPKMTVVDIGCDPPEKTGKFNNFVNRCLYYDVSTREFVTVYAPSEAVNHV